MIGGTRHDRFLWGGYSDACQPAGVRLIALPMRSGTALSELTDGVERRRQARMTLDLNLLCWQLPQPSLRTSLLRPDYDLTLQFDPEVFVNRVVDVIHQGQHICSLGAAFGHDEISVLG